MKKRAPTIFPSTICTFGLPIKSIQELGGASQTILNPHYFTHMIIMVMVIMIAFEYEIKLESNLISSLQIVLMVALLFLCVSLPLTL
jgi:hypothetical protein